VGLITANGVFDFETNEVVTGVVGTRAKEIPWRSDFWWLRPFSFTTPAGVIFYKGNSNSTIVAN
jgi:hypothetical protein